LNKLVATFEKHTFLSQIDLSKESKHGFLFCGNYILKYW
jgi:hypothetical protein